jgi:superfamily II DNA or RNA helicase
MLLTQTQRQIVNNTLKHKKVAIESPTGTGKTFMSTEILKRLSYNSLCIVVNTNHLVDHWKNELHKNDMFNNKIVTVSTIQSVYKYKDLNFDILIWDEAHHSVADKWYSFIKNNNFNRIIMLTATLERDDDRHNLLIKEKFHFISNKSYDDGISEKLISDFQIINVSISLTPEEIIRYKRVTANINALFPSFNYNIASVTSQIRYNPKAGELVRCFSERKKIVNNATNKKIVSSEILKHENFTSAVIFSEFISFSRDIQTELKENNISASMYNSQVKNRDKVLNDFRNNVTKVLLCVKALDEGMNIKDIDLEIETGFSSQKRQAIQRAGRSLRYKKDKIAKIYNLYCYDTVEERWLMKRQESFDKKKITWRR